VIEDALLEHALKQVWPEWRLFITTLRVAMPTLQHVPARTRGFVNFLPAVFGGNKVDPWLQAAGCATPPGRSSDRSIFRFKNYPTVSNVN